ncbi:MAG TPA: pyrroline-5-carboxylate reductase [Planctomycetota bacterium]|nr:pyrroline-5-carboxylate reductase [Planctomycetota bacterium]
MLSGKKLGILGVGKIGEALATGLIRKGEVRAEDIMGSVRREESLRRLDRLGMAVTTDSAAVVARSDIVLVATKPQAVEGLLAVIDPAVKPGQIFISVAASVPTAFIEARIGHPVPVVRAMPNTPCMLGAGMTVLAAGKHAGEKELHLARSIFEAVGRTAILEERLMDGVTGLSGSGPAYIYVVIEALSEAGVKLGIPRETALLLASQTVFGAAKMVLDLGEHPALLKDVVTTPAGCTIDGLLELEEGKLRVTLVKAVVKAAERARELVRDSR